MNVLTHLVEWLTMVDVWKWHISHFLGLFFNCIFINLVFYVSLRKRPLLQDPTVNGAPPLHQGVNHEPRFGIASQMFVQSHFPSCSCWPIEILGLVRYFLWHHSFTHHPARSSKPMRVEQQSSGAAARSPQPITLDFLVHRQPCLFNHVTCYVSL